MTLTGAIKNMFGAVTGLNKTQCHKKFPKPEDFVHVLVDVFTAVKPQLVLMDGIIAMDGNGPAAGNLRDAGLLIASEDSVAVDAVFSYLIGMKPLEVLTTKEAYNRKLGEADLENLEILGEKIEKKLIKDYKLPGLKFYMNLPAPAIKFVASFVKFSPYINEGLCTRCKICVKTCPVDAITVSKENSFIDYHKCVKCMCCHEVCPYNSVEYKSNILARRFGL
jgi:ferredoxin